MDCQTSQELIPASMLDALEMEEQVALLEHLRECVSCRAEAASLRPVVGALGFAAPDAGKPAPDVKLRVMSKVGATAKPHAAPLQQRRWIFRSIPALVPAAIALILILGLGAAVVSLQSQVAQQRATLDHSAQLQASLQQFLLNANVETVPVKMDGPATSATAMLYTTGDKVAMVVKGLPPLEGDSVYQCWWINSQTGEIVAGTFFKVDAEGAGLWVWKIPEGDENNKMTITQENQPGKTKAEGPVVLTVEF